MVVFWPNTLQEPDCKGFCVNIFPLISRLIRQSTLEYSKILQRIQFWLFRKSYSVKALQRNLWRKLQKEKPTTYLSCAIFPLEYCVTVEEWLSYIYFFYFLRKSIVGSGIRTHEPRYPRSCMTQEPRYRRNYNYYTHRTGGVLINYRSYRRFTTGTGARGVTMRSGALNRSAIPTHELIVWFSWFKFIKPMNLS